MISVDSDYNITIIRGDSGYVLVPLVEVVDDEEVPYTPKEGETLRFAMASKWGASESECHIIRQIDTSDLKLYFYPEDTKSLKFGKYKYDLEYINTEGYVDTILRAIFIVSEEVY